MPGAGDQRVRGALAAAESGLGDAGRVGPNVGQAVEQALHQRRLRQGRFSEGKAGVEFLAADMPYVNRLSIGVMALVAEEEARATSTRTKAALVAAKARGIKLGNPRLKPGGLKPGDSATAAETRAAW